MGKNTVPLRSSLLSVAVVNAVTKSDSGRRGSIQLTLTDNSPSMREGRGGNSRQEPGGMLITSLLSGFCSARLTIQPRPTCLGMVPPAVGQAFLYQLASKKMLHRHAHRPAGWRKFFKGVLPRCVKISDTNQDTEHKLKYTGVYK